MTRYLITAILAATFTCASCKKRPPTLSKAPPKPQTNEQTAIPLAPDSLRDIGWDTAGLVNVWVTALKQVETEESADDATEALKKVSEQFDYLIERAEKLPKVTPEEFKQLDSQIDVMLSSSASGLERETQRIYLLPDEIRQRIIPASENLMKKFQTMSRSIHDTQTTTPQPSDDTDEGS